MKESDETLRSDSGYVTCSSLILCVQKHFNSGILKLLKGIFIKVSNSISCPWRNGPPGGAVSEEVNGPPSARGSVRYGVRFHRFSYSSSNFAMATSMLCLEDYQEEDV